MAEVPPIPLRTTVALFNDMLNYALRATPERSRIADENGVVTNTARAVAEFRKRDIPIFWVQVDRRADRADAVDTLTDLFIEGGMKHAAPLVGGSWEASNVDELPVQPGDQVIIKPRYDPFYGTPLDYLLRARGVTTILLGGVSTIGGVESCARSGRDRGYNMVVLSDCCAGAGVWLERELHDWAISRILPRFSRVMTADRALQLLA